MNKNHLVSIVLPVHNGAMYLREAIESILSQTYNEWELIIVDDESTDESPDIIQKYVKLDTRIRSYRNSKNIKLPASLNVGFSYANGAYYTWTSDDNLFRPCALEKMVFALEANRDLSMVYADYSIINENSVEIKEVISSNLNDFIIGNIYGACFLYTSDIAKRIGGYDTNLFLAEDYDYWIRINKFGKIGKLNENLYQYRSHSNSLTDTKKKQIALKTYDVLEKHFLYLYLYSKRKKTQFIFFDYMMEKYYGDKKELLLVLESIEKTYVFYRIKKSIIRVIKNSTFWHLLRHVKKRIGNKNG